MRLSDRLETLSDPLGNWKKEGADRAYPTERFYMAVWPLETSLIQLEERNTEQYHNIALKVHE